MESGLLKLKQNRNLYVTEGPNGVAIYLNNRLLLQAHNGVVTAFQVSNVREARLAQRCLDLLSITDQRIIYPGLLVTYIDGMVSKTQTPMEVLCSQYKNKQ